MRRQRSWLLALIAALPGPAGTQPRSLGLISYEEPVVSKLDIDASAVVAFTIRANGRVADAVTLTATNRVLGDSAREAVLAWRFERDPTLGSGRDAEPSKVLRRELIEFVFKRDGTVTSVSHYDSAKSWFPHDYTPVVRLVQAAALEPPLARLEQPPSAATTDLIRNRTSGGSVLVSYVVDETGAVRVPIAERGDNQTLIDAAVALVGDWRYAPPTQDGQPVVVEARETLFFRPLAD
ncbi:MAG TPA: energy transducer TonB [Gammaproteobacteria bacterium]